PDPRDRALGAAWRRGPRSGLRLAPQGDTRRMKPRLPPKRERPRLNLREPLQREWPRHRRFVRSFGCSVPLCTTNTPIEFAHLRSAANTGTGLKPHDAFGVSLCGADPACGIEGHHAAYHRI